MAKLSEKEIQDRLKKLSGWTLEQGQLRKMFVFKDFREAVAFVLRVAFIAESMDHHPDIDIRYKKVALNVMTHSEGGLTEKDFMLAAGIDAIGPF
jgi:4a-hydroxytetrahydrobiopterin dehydratase